MTTPSRAALLVKTHKILKKHYKPVSPVAERSLLEHVLYACLLEDSTYAAADKAFADVQRSFFDWNEVRVTTVKELAEVLRDQFDPAAAATNLRRALQSVFEATYSFDIESFKKKTIGQATKDLEKMPGVTPFVVAYATQSALGGHFVPIDNGSMEALLILGAVTEKEAATGAVPGLERAIPKSKGIEFGSLLHQLGADLLAKPFAPEVRNILTSIAPEAKDRLPKRGAKKRSEQESAPPAQPTASSTDKPPESSATNGRSGKKKPPEAADQRGAKDQPREAQRDKERDQDKGHGKPAAKAKDGGAKEPIKTTAKKESAAGEKKKPTADVGKSAPPTKGAAAKGEPAKGLPAKGSSVTGLSKSKPR